MTFRTALLAATALGTLPLAAFAGDLAHTLSFEPIDYASTDAQKREVIATPSATLDGQKIDLGYHILARGGDMVGDTEFAVLTDQNGEALTDAEGKTVSASADYTSILPVGDRIWSITHFESRPAAMYLSELKQDEAGQLTPISTRPIDFSGVGGLWVPCAGSVTPWNTHLGSEEYPPDARAQAEATALDQIDDYDYPMARYFGLDPETMSLDDFRGAFNPYRYGYPTEVAVSEDGETTVTKHYSMGRVAVELAYVLPDRKTAYISDDGTNVILQRFVADNEDDLSSGTLYAAKWTQTSGEGAGAADIEWVDLGHTDDATIQAAIDGGVTFADIFETADIADDGTCPEGFMSSNAEAKAECLKVKDGMEAVASRVETRRYASMMGATAEFRKMEGITYNPDKNVVYYAMSEVSKAMTEGSKGDKGGRDDVKLPENICGAVYELTLDGTEATSMKALVAGIPRDYAAGEPGEGNICDLDGIANPDNISYIPGTGVLMIGEDTVEGHQNDVVWAYDIDKDELTRVFSSPYGSETTSVYWHGDVNGHAYITAVVQHPYGESDEDKLESKEDAQAYVGYIGPFPALTTAGN